MSKIEKTVTFEISNNTDLERYEDDYIAANIHLVESEFCTSIAT